uniref:Uncharacterized protein n=1 Tax=Anguilla anguilla TaxID=7936 RepID=A0A0E9XDA8_ANGAN
MYFWITIMAGPF